MQRPLYSILALLTLLLAGCETAHRFQVDAINTSLPPTERSYVLVPADPETSLNDLRFQEAARYARRALAGEGYRSVDDPADAAMVITIEAAVGDPQPVTVSRSHPIYVQTGGYFREVSRPVRDRNGNVSYVSSTIWYPPYDRFVGTYDSTDTYLVYEKRFALTAFTNGGGEVAKLPQRWSVVVTNRDSSSDLRAYLPLLATVAADYIDENTGRQVVVKLKEDDPRVLAIQGRATE